MMRPAPRHEEGDRLASPQPSAGAPRRKRAGSRCSAGAAGVARVALVALAVLGATTAPAHAQAAGTTTDIEVPAVMIEQGDAQIPGADEALDLANIVQSAAKGITTVQEAPAIVTVVTADEIRERQFQDLEQLIDTVPGWQRASIYHSTFPTPLVRGQVQAVQFLHDGLSLFDPFVNVASVSRVQPMELIKRVEMITGPGGVLWGSNSLLGILNVITKDAEDVDGVELGAQAGDGRGDRLMARAYAMVGAPNLLGGKLKLFAHASVETYQGPEFDMPLLLFHGALPQPNSANVYGPLTGTDQPQSTIVTVDGKLSYGKLQLRVYAPFGRKYNPMGLSGEPVRETLPEDPMCPAGTTDMFCVDPRRASRQNREDVFDRYAVLEYRTRFWKDKAGLAARGYVQQFVRGFEPLQVLAPSQLLLLPGGLAFKADLTSYRTGGAFDGDVEVAPQLRVLYGAEAFHEWKPDHTTASGAGDGTPSELVSPYDLTRVSLLCPRINVPGTTTLVPIAGCPLTFAFPASRTVLGAYLDPQVRPGKHLIFDLGGRVQVSPAALGSLSYAMNTTLAATMVWNFIPNWHLKLNYAQGFRPPVFNNTTSNGEGVQIGGNPDLTVETSDAMQAEINARIFKGERRIRELSFRVDGSYTRVKNLIQVASGNYGNSGDRGMTSLEFLGNLYLQGGHRLEFGYTYLRGDTSDKGRLRALPENWFSLAGVWSLLGNKLTATTTLRVTGAAEDPNRLVEYRGKTYFTCPATDPTCSTGPKAGAVTPDNATTVMATDLVLDRLPPIADLSLGLQYAPTPRLAIRASAYNALFGHSYQPDVFFDYEPHLEYLPNPSEGFRAYLAMMIQY
ncbi:MAG TPA: TonB-dependent receptor [Kofleriaceae bacterium]|jgi:outer membrane receptor protein involved in Fe transport|nr:TonB-dependent receptor [Kofleriaceae bacterium]